MTHESVRRGARVRTWRAGSLGIDEAQLGASGPKARTAGAGGAHRADGMDGASRAIVRRGAISAGRGGGALVRSAADSGRTRGGRAKRLLEVTDQIVGIFNPDRDPDERIADPELGARLGRDGRMRHDRRMLDE